MMQLRAARQQVGRVLRSVSDRRARCQRIGGDGADEWEATLEAPDHIDIVPSQEAKTMLDEGDVDPRRASRLQDLEDRRGQTCIDGPRARPKIGGEVAEPR